MRLRHIKRRTMAAMLSTTVVEVRGPVEFCEWVKRHRGEAIYLLRRIANLRTWRRPPGCPDLS